MANPFPFSAGDVLTAAELNQIGDGIAFTPTWTNGVTVGNGTITAHYVEINDFISYSINFQLGSTSAISDDVRLEHPIQSNNTYQAPATCRGFAFDASAGIYYAVMGTAFNSSEMRVRWMRQSSATDSIFGSDLSSGAFPFTWTTSDRLVFGTYYRRA